jgi:Polyketide cyclase / dehydrase and lipid transport
MRYEVIAGTTKPSAQVWALLVDVEGWPGVVETYRTVRRLDPGPLRVGSRAHVEQVGLRPGDWQVTELVERRSFTWSTTHPGLTIVACHLVAAEPDGCRLTLGIEIRGPLSGLVALLLGGKTRRYLDLELARFTDPGDA